MRIAYAEAALRSQFKEAGGVWDGKRKLWLLPRAAARRLKRLAASRVAAKIT